MESISLSLTLRCLSLNHYPLSGHKHSNPRRMAIVSHQLAVLKHQHDCDLHLFPLHTLWQQVLALLECCAEVRQLACRIARHDPLKRYSEENLEEENSLAVINLMRIFRWHHLENFDVCVPVLAIRKWEKRRVGAWREGSGHGGN
jgi:hypothetical protein